MVVGLNGKNGAPVQQNVIKVLGTECEVVVDQNQKELDKNVQENTFKLIFVT